MRSAVAAALVSLTVLAAGGLHILDNAQDFRADYHRSVTREVGGYGQALERSLQQAYSAVSLMGSMLQRQGKIHDFQLLANTMTESYGLISTLQLAPKGIVSDIYPLRGEEKAISHNLLADPARHDGAQAAISSRQFTVTPPVTLVQGGQAIIGRLPVFLERDGADEFWGFVIAVFRVSALSSSTHLEKLAHAGYDYALTYRHRDGREMKLAENGTKPLREAAQSMVPLPNGDTLVVSVAPRSGWPDPPFFRLQLAMLAAFALLLGIFVYLSLRRPEILRGIVAIRTQEIVRANMRLSEEITAHTKTHEALKRNRDFLDTIVENIPHMIFVKDAADLKFVRFNRGGEELLGYSREEMIGKNDYDFFPKSQADFFTAKDRDALARGGISDIQVEEIDTCRKGRRLLHTKKIPILDKHGTPQYLLGISEDVTDRHATEIRLKQINKIYNVLSASSDAIMRIHDRSALLHEICNILVRYGGFSMACVYFGRIDQKDINIATIVGDYTRFPQRLGNAIRNADLGEIGIIKSIKESKPVVCDGLNAVENIWCKDNIGCGYNSCAAFPVHQKRQVAGGLALFSNDPTLFSKEDMRLLERLAEKISFALNAMENSAQRKNAEERLRLTARVFDNSAEGIMITDANNRIISVNKSFSTFTLYTSEEVMGRNPSFLASGRHDAMFYRTMWHSLKETGEWHGEIKNRRKNGEIYPEWLNLSVIRDETGSVTNHIAIFTDLTLRRQIEDRAKFLSDFDSLTGLPNRDSFEKQTKQALAAAHNAKHLAAVLFLDIDRFSMINETFGHRAGDDVLRVIAQRLKENHPGCVSRLGGDEFTILLPRIQNPRDAGMIAQKILTEIGRPIVVGESETYGSASIGIAVFPHDGTDVATLNKNADTAMYRAMQNNGGCYRFYTQDMNADSHKRVALESKLHNALERGEFELHYQPLFDARSRLIVGAEALLRWNSNGDESIPPDTFIPLLEDTGLIIPVGRWVLHTACEHNQAWRDAGFPNVYVAVNFSAHQFKDRAFFQSLTRTLRKAGGNPKFLEIELTERVLMQDCKETMSNLKRLKSLGARISIDDFGTGYSSLSYLQRFPLDVLKIDMSFVHEAPQKPEAAAIVKSIIAMSQAFSLKTIAEGVETAEQAEFVTNAGCDLLQGYLLSRPLSHQAFLELLCAQGKDRQTLVADNIIPLDTVSHPGASLPGQH